MAKELYSFVAADVCKAQTTINLQVMDGDPSPRKDCFTRCLQEDKEQNQHLRGNSSASASHSHPSPKLFGELPALDSRCYWAGGTVHSLPFPLGYNSPWAYQRMLGAGECFLPNAAPWSVGLSSAVCPETFPGTLWITSATFSWFAVRPCLTDIQSRIISFLSPVPYSRTKPQACWSAGEGSEAWGTSLQSVRDRNWQLLIKMRD